MATDKRTTELDSITWAGLADGDQIGVVDVSDTSMAPSGTSKRLAKSELAGGVTALAAAAVAAHEADTTNVHGIADTSALYRAGGIDVAVADGGTGASTAAGARTALGVDYATIAASAEVSSRFAPLSVKADTESIWIGPTAFAISAGTPAIAGALLIPALAFDPTSIEIALAPFRTPASWVTADVTLWYYTGSGTGNIVINPRVYIAGVGESAAPSAEAGITSSITLAGGTPAVVASQACGTFTCQPTKACAFWLQRNATSGSDTNAADLSVVGVTIAKAS